jgi:FAD/FMN-containing dehydrogenase
MVGSEGTLGVITSIWLRLTPAPEAAWPVVAFFDGVDAGCEAIRRVVGTGLGAAAIEYLDENTMRLAGAGFPSEIPQGTFCVLTEADGSHDEAVRVRQDLIEVLGEDARAVHAPDNPEEIAALWRWREGVTLRVQAHRGGKVSEDIAVPLERLAEAIRESLAIAARLGLPAASWGHAGDGNLHTTYLIDREVADERRIAAEASNELFELALRLGGTISGEHGVGALKRSWLERRLGPKAAELHAAVKQAFDPQNLLNPGKK